MSFSYVPSLPSSRDVVRFYISDVDSSNVYFQDEEIDALIAIENAQGSTAEAIPFFVVARCLSTLLVRWASVGEGELENRLAVLLVKNGIEAGAKEALEERIKEYRALGNQQNGTGSRSSFFRAVDMGG